MKRRRTPSRKERARRKKRAQRSSSAKESQPAAGGEPRFRLPNRTQLKALRERFDDNQLLPEDYPVLAEIVEFRYQLPNLLRQQGMTVERLKELMGLTESETTADETDNEPNCQPSGEGDSPGNVDTCGDGS